jgi:hypothetical protein
MSKSKSDNPIACGQKTKTNILTDDFQAFIAWQAQVFGRDGCQRSTPQ